MKPAHLIATRLTPFMFPSEPSFASPARRLPDATLCRARDRGLAEFADCLVGHPDECRYAVNFGQCYLCRHPQWREIAARTANLQGDPPPNAGQTSTTDGINQKRAAP